MNMLPNRKDRRISFSLLKKLFPKGFSLLELFITIMIMGIIAGGLVAMMSPFEHSKRLESSALKLQEDLRQAQTYSMGGGENYIYYGVLFFNNLGPDNRQGWKIVCYCQTTAGRCTGLPAIPIDDTTLFEVIKSSEELDNADLFDNTFFDRGVTIVTPFDPHPPPTSDFQIGDRIVFTQRGSATCDGDGTHLLGTLSCPGTDIVLTAFGRAVILRITPLTGHVQMLQ